MAGTKAQVKKVYDRYDRGEMNPDQFVRAVEDIGVPVTSDFQRLVQKQASDRCGFNNVVRALNLNQKKAGGFESDVKPNTVVYTRKTKIDNAAHDSELEQKVARKLNIDLNGRKRMAAKEAAAETVSTAIRDFSSGKLNAAQFRDTLRSNRVEESQEITKLIQKKEYGDYVGHKELGHVVMQQFKNTDEPTPDKLIQRNNVNAINVVQGGKKHSSKRQDALLKEEELRTNGVYMPRKKKPESGIVTAHQTNGNILAWSCEDRHEIGSEKNGAARKVKTDKLAHHDFMSWSGSGVQDQGSKASSKSYKTSQRSQDGGDIIGWRFGEDGNSGAGGKKQLQSNFNASHGLY
eukprot:CAMPEP_0115020604 /NCGR_PEP_ID=MMETSP0216-20121206/30276_1 /TAXON_ID=223996 /ORGANISM="Protocruzia adherens, Strain Boccale" /LENGTH=347 /DNA_ID=CAMNT_0002392573 /DNA_START=155 /DNA_END=1198 /DNA_ORIENTATION=-